MSKQNPRKWSEKEIEFLVENYSKYPRQFFIEYFKCDLFELDTQRKKLGLRKFSQVKWHEKEIQFLKKYFPKYGGKWCAEKLGRRSFHATHKMAEKLGLKIDWKYNYTDAEGYIVLCHNRNKKILEHRYVMEQHLGRKLKPTELVHHIDGNKKNNDISNLELTTRKDHINTHRQSLLDGMKNRFKI